MQPLLLLRRLRAASPALLLSVLVVACAGENGLLPEAGDGDGDGTGDGDTGNVGVGGTGTTGDGDAASWVPPDCSLIANAGYEVCGSTDTTCTAVFTNGAGCSAVCGAAGLTCVGAYENAEDSCGADDSRPEVACDSGHSSDYCVCEGMGAPRPGSGGSTSGDGDGDGATGGSGNPGAGGSPSGGSGTGGSSGIGPKACGCESPAGEFGEVSDTIEVGNGQTYDGGCKIFRADPDELGDGSQEEGQLPIFSLGNGATLKNVVIGASGADGIHTEGNATLQNIRWLDVGEDALTIKESGTVTLDCGSAANASDKIFQINAASTFHLKNFTAKGAGKLVRQVGGSTWEMTLTIDHCDISDMSESIFRTDSSSSHVTFTNSRYSDIGDLFIFGSSSVNGNSDQSSVSNIQSY